MYSGLLLLHHSSIISITSAPPTSNIIHHFFFSFSFNLYHLFQSPPSPLFLHLLFIFLLHFPTLHSHYPPPPPPPFLHTSTRFIWTQQGESPITLAQCGRRLLISNNGSATAVTSVFSRPPPSPPRSSRTITYYFQPPRQLLCSIYLHISV